MNYKEYQKALAAINKSAKKELDDLQGRMYEVQRMKDDKVISEKEAFERDQKLAEIFDSVKNRYARSAERLKMNFAKQDCDIKVGDIIWAVSKGAAKVLKIENIKLAAFDYPMLKLFGTQLTLYGQPYKKQLQHPKGGIYQKDITSINGEPYTYKTRV